MGTAIILQLLCLLLLGALHLGESDPFTEEEAGKWIEEYNERAMKVYSQSVLSAWRFQTNITDYNAMLQSQTNYIKAEFNKQAFLNASQFDWQNFENETLKRMFRVIVNIDASALPLDKMVKISELRANMQSIYSVATVCEEGGSPCYLLEPGLTQILSESRDWDVLLYIWKKWRDNTGKKMKTIYRDFTDLSNQAAVLNGYQDTAEFWKSFYETEGFEKECERLYQDVRPLYEQLHSYVKRELQNVYGAHRFPDTGHIPAHILGNMWAQSWSNLAVMTQPYKDKETVDVTQALKDQNYTAVKIFQLADNFFKSLGMPPMPDAFWNHSMLERPNDGRSVVCHASAWNFYNQNDFRIKQCTDITMSDLVTTHHEMGHVQYYLQYKNQPVMFKKGANPGFHEAVGDVMSLSVSTPEHLKKAGLLKDVDTSTESDINFLMSQALSKIAFLPYGYLIDQWRWSVFRGDVDISEYNRRWWDLRCKYQGISPPVKRTEDDFDPGAKYHITSHTPYIRYFVSYIIQFQFYKALCKESGELEKRPLHRCDIYQSREAGAKLSEMLNLGSSQPWQVAMKKLTGQEKMDAGPLLEYFKPLSDWLKVQNKGKPTSWSEHCPRGMGGSDDNTSSGTCNKFRGSVLFVIISFIRQLAKWS